ncbi:MAG: branched-chain amino acid ABC transporter permease [Desulfatibacillum sp.]|nr:branched-chain amino acid ABC transporter permease [Desulfatibacillum sp.]
MNPATAMYIIQALHGLAYGMLLFLVASGLTLIFGMVGILNMAHASLFMLSAYLCYQVLAFTNSFWMSLFLAPLITACLGLLLERFFLRKVQAHGLGHIAELLLTMGISMVIAESVKSIWGTESLVISIPPSLDGLASFAGIHYPIYRLFIIGLSFCILALLVTVLYKTKLGKIIRATASDPGMVSILGINTPKVFAGVFALGAWMAGVAGVAAAPMLTVFPGLADQVGMDAFVVVVVGGLGSLLGAFVVSLTLGELNSFGVQFIPKLAPVLVFGFMAIVLSLKPNGFFGEGDH